jgi:hypothetical protein
MSCCCQNSLDLGCHNPCKPLVFSYIVPADADYTLLCKGAFLQSITQAQTAGELLTFDTSSLNQNMLFSLQIALGETALSFEDLDGNIYDCFGLQTTIGGLSAPSSIPLTLI